jgi:signal transduction histidine kinase
LFTFRPGNVGLHRAHLEGTIIGTPDESTVFLQDGTGGIAVSTRDSATPPFGSSVEVVGFPITIDGVPRLQEAQVKPKGKSSPVKPVTLADEDSLSIEHHGTLVRIRGRLVGSSPQNQGYNLSLQFGLLPVQATLADTGKDKKLSRLAVGSVLEATGVYTAKLTPDHKVRAFDLMLRSPSDIRVLQRPSWWMSGKALWVLSGLGLILGLALAWAAMLRREVSQRTAQLRFEIDGHKRTERELQAEIAERKRMQEQVERTHKDLLSASREAGMAEVATSVLHNVGNVLNSANVSTTLLVDLVKRSKAGNVSRAALMLQEHSADLGDFLSHDQRGRQLPSYLARLADHLNQEQTTLLAELESVRKSLEHVKDIVTMQQNYAKVIGVVENVKPAELMEDAVRMNAGALERHEVTVVRDYDPDALPEIAVEKHKVLQVLVNLVRNAKYACDESPQPDKRVVVRVWNGEEKIRFQVVDNGVGIPPENMSRIFHHGFTTRKGGHGFGLHSGALVAQDLGGTLRAESEGPGKGATFVLELPLRPAAARQVAPHPEPQPLPETQTVGQTPTFD